MKIRGLEGLKRFACESLTSSKLTILKIKRFLLDRYSLNNPITEILYEKGS